MKLRQGKGSSDLELQKLRNNIHENERDIEKKYIERNTQDDIVIQDLKRKLEKSENNSNKEKEEDRRILISELENMKNSLEECYKTIDSLEEILESKEEELIKLNQEIDYELGNLFLF